MVFDIIVSPPYNDYMPYKSGEWGEQARARSKRRREYFRSYSRRKYQGSRGEGGYGIGLAGEKLALDILTGSQLVHKSYDLEWNGKRVEVKTSRPVQSPYTAKTRPFLRYRKHWSFDIRSQVDGKTDLYLLIGLDENDAASKIFLVPASKVTSKGGIGIGRKKSKYDRYLVVQKGGESK